VAGFDAKSDGRDSALADAASLSYRYDKREDVLWFRVGLYNVPNKDAFGISVALDTASDDAVKANWWGQNKTFRFDRLVTAWVTRGPNGFQGIIGISDAKGATAKEFSNLRRDNVQIRVESDSIVVGVKRTDVTDKLKFNVIAAVGSNQILSDDVPTTGSVPIDLSAERPTRGLREIDVSRNNLKLPADYKTIDHNQQPSIKKYGHGKQALLLIPGMYSGSTSFTGFIDRNNSQYRMFVVTPPGINGAHARPVPASTSSFGQLTWTRLLEKDILDLIRRERLIKPVIVAERQPGSISAIELALKSPDEIGGVILIGTNLVQFMPSPKDPTRKAPASIQERLQSVDEAWAAQWFKYVTPETWLSNDLRAEFLTPDVAKGEAARNGFEMAPLEVKIRYLCEFWASDLSADLDRLRVPVLVLIPGFDEKFLAEPANASAKTVYIDSWESLRQKSPNLEIVKISNTRLLLLDDQPKEADDAVSAFMEKVSKPGSHKY
jgi:pimeloyl-ACP methyl ester carboxylesterase